MPRKRPKEPVSRGKPLAEKPPEKRLAAVPVVPLLLLAVAVLATIGLYYGDAPLEHVLRRRAALQFLAAPDELFRMWCGGKLANFSLFDRWPIVLLAGITLVGAWLAGRLALWLIGVEKLLTRLERVVFALGVGLNLLSLYALAIGLAGGLKQRWLFAGPLVLLAVLNGVRFIYLTALSKPAPGEAPINPASETPLASLVPADSRAWYWWLLAALPFAIVLVLGGMLPPWAYDVREYHLQAPKEWFQNGRIDFLPHNIYANMPLGSELTGLWGMALAGGKDGWWWGAMAGKTVMASYSLVTAAALIAFGRRVHSLAAGAIAAVIFLSTPWIVGLAVAGYNEGPVALYATLAIFALWLSSPLTPSGTRRDERAPLPTAAPQLLLLAGFCAGSAVACKYPPLLFLVVPLVAWVAGLDRIAQRLCRVGCAHQEQPHADSADTPDSARKTDSVGTAHPTGFWAGGAPVLRAAVYCLAIAAGCGLWFAKNAVLTRNPTYPLLYAIFDGRTRTPEKDRQWTRVHSPQPDQYGRRFPLSGLASQIAWNGWQTAWASVTIPPLVLMAWFARRQRPLLAALALWAVFVFLAWWLTTHRLDRFLVLLLPLASLVAAIGVFAVDHPAWRAATLGFVALGAVTQFSFITLHPDNRYFAPLAALRYDDREMSLQGLRVEPAHRWLNDHAQPGERVLLVGDAEPFDLEMPAIYNTCFDDCQFTRIFQGRSRTQRLELLRQLHIKYVFFSWSHLNRYRSEGNYGYTSDYPTRELVHEELVGQQRLLVPISLGDELTSGELFRVANRETAESP
jgi:hypothetical protein